MSDDHASGKSTSVFATLLFIMVLVFLFFAVIAMRERKERGAQEEGRTIVDM